MSTNFHLAPPSKTVDGLFSVPIDIESINAGDLQPNESFLIYPIVIRNWKLRFDPRFELEVWKPESAKGIRVGLVHKSNEFFKASRAKILAATTARDRPRLECGSEVPFTNEAERSRRLSSSDRALLLRTFPASWEADFVDGDRPAMRMDLPPFTQSVVALKLSLFENIKTKKTDRDPFRAAKRQDEADRRRSCLSVEPGRKRCETR